MTVGNIPQGSFDAILDGMITGDIPFGVDQGIDIPCLGDAQTRIIKGIEDQATRVGMKVYQPNEKGWDKSTNTMTLYGVWENAEGSTINLVVAVDGNLNVSVNSLDGVGISDGNDNDLDWALGEGAVSDMNVIRDAFERLRNW